MFYIHIVFGVYVFSFYLCILFFSFYRVLFMIFKQLQQQQPLRSGAS
jgi:hypothetical protein